MPSENSSEDGDDEVFSEPENETILEPKVNLDASFLFNLLREVDCFKNYYKN